MPVLDWEPALWPPNLLDTEPATDGADTARWWALHVRPRTEKAVARRLRFRQEVIENEWFQAGASLGLRGVRSIGISTRAAHALYPGIGVCHHDWSGVVFRASVTPCGVQAAKRKESCCALPGAAREGSRGGDDPDFEYAVRWV